MSLLILVGVIPAILFGSSEIVVVVGEVVHEEFAFADVFLEVDVAFVFGFGEHFGRIDEAHVVGGVTMDKPGGWMGSWKSGLGA
jgi:hypothetical protein